MSRPVFCRTTQRLREIERIVACRHGLIPATDDADVFLVPIAQCYRRLLIKAGKTATVHDIIDRLEVCKIIDGSGLVWRQLRDAAVEAIDNPRMEKARAIAQRLLVTYDERTKLNLRTIGAHDVDPREQARRRKERKRQYSKARAARLRAERGAKSREEYLAANSVNRTKPWERLNIGRSKWYALGKPEPPAEPHGQVGYPLEPTVRNGKPTCPPPESAARPMKGLPTKVSRFRASPLSTWPPAI
jgi:hypothetical protein